MRSGPAAICCKMLSEQPPAVAKLFRSDSLYNGIQLAPVDKAGRLSVGCRLCNARALDLLDADSGSGHNRPSSRCCAGTMYASKYQDDNDSKERKMPIPKTAMMPATSTRFVVRRWGSIEH